jgi:glycosyltransferase involved in cell wall biosynthesis
MKIWLPAIRSGTGTDVFTLRLHQALTRMGVDAEITWFPLAAELAPSLLRKRQPPRGTTIIHANGWTGDSLAKFGLPVVVTVHHLVHDPAYAPFRSPAQALYHRLHLRRRDLHAIRAASAVTAVSEYVAQTVREFSGRATVEVVHNWVDPEVYAPGPAVPHADRCRILVVGNRSRRKGYDLLPNFVRALGDGFEVRCTGGLRDGPGRALPGVHWLGKLSEGELVREYQHCDLVASLSRYEGFGYSALEAMACEKPFIGFRTSGVSEVVSPHAGILVGIDDVESLAEAAGKAMSDPLLRAAMGQYGRQRVESYFTERLVIRYLAIYEAVQY